MALPVQTGTGQNGEWKKQSFVLQTTDNNPKYFTFEIFDGKEGKLARYNIQQGKDYTVWFDIRAHEWNGRWFNQVFVNDVREKKANESAQEGATGDRQ